MNYRFIRLKQKLVDFKVWLMNWIWFNVIVRLYPEHSRRGMVYQAAMEFDQRVYQDLGEKECLDIARKELVYKIAEGLHKEQVIRYTHGIDTDRRFPTFVVRAKFKVLV